MKKIFLIIWITSISLGIATAQDMYIWCPDNLNPNPQSEVLAGDKVELTINDNRIISSKARVKCTFEDLSASLSFLVKSTYPNAIFLDKSGFAKNHVKGRVYIQLSIFEYYATFKLGSWYGNTSYRIEITDYRNDEIKEYTRDFSVENKSINFIGLTTAKNNLKKSYIKSTNELLSYVSEKL